MLPTRVSLARFSACAMAVMNDLAVRITMLCQHIYNYCTIAISVNEQCSYVALLHELIVYMNQIKSNQLYLYTTYLNKI